MWRRAVSLRPGMSSDRSHRPHAEPERVRTRRLATAGALGGLLMFATALPTQAWQSSSPAEKRAKYCSENGLHCLVVTPAGLRLSAKSLALLTSRGEQRGDHTRVKLDLAGSSTPSHALVSNDGRCVVTIIDYSGYNRPSDRVMIFRSDGSLVRRLALEEILSELDIRMLNGSSAGARWTTGQRIVEDTRRLELRIPKCWRSWNCDDEAIVEIDLATGSLTRPVSDLLPHSRVTLAPEELRALGEPIAPRSDTLPVCRGGSTFDPAPPSRAIDSAELLSSLLHGPLPEWPEMARKVRLSGLLVMELTIDRGGQVRCSRAVRGLPFGISETVAQRLLEWRFSPAPPADSVDLRAGLLAFRFGAVDPESEDPKP